MLCGAAEYNVHANYLLYKKHMEAKLTSFPSFLPQWADVHNAMGITPNTPIDSNDEPAGNNQQRMQTRGY